MATAILCDGCHGTGTDPKSYIQVRCRTCGGSGLTPASGALKKMAYDPRHWQNRAEEMRSLAEDMRDEGSKAIMLRMALDYENMAARIENSKPAAG